MIIKKLNRKTVIHIFTGLCIFIFMFSIIKYNELDLQKGILGANANGNLSNKKICWGIKREPNHKQPDVGALNKKVLEEYKGICIGNSESKKVYLTFDSRV